MAPAALAYTYTDRASIERVLSEAGVRLRLDDDGDSQATEDDADKLQDVIDLATETVNFYCWSYYRDARLVTSNLVWRWCSILAAYDLDRRRNNPPSESLADWAAEIEEKLKEVQAGRAMLPGIGRRMTGAPKSVNWRIDQHYNWRTIRVETTTSSKVATPRDADRAEQVGGAAEQGM